MKHMCVFKNIANHPPPFNVHALMLIFCTYYVKPTEADIFLWKVLSFQIISFTRIDDSIRCTYTWEKCYIPVKIFEASNFTLYTCYICMDGCMCCNFFSKCGDRVWKPHQFLGPSRFSGVCSDFIFFKTQICIQKVCLDYLVSSANLYSDE